MHKETERGKTAATSGSSPIVRRWIDADVLLMPYEYACVRMISFWKSKKEKQMTHRHLGCISHILFLVACEFNKMLHKLKQMMSSSSVNCINATLTQNDKTNGIWPRLRRKIKTVLKRWEFCAWLNWYLTGSILLSTSASWMRCYDTISLSWSVSQNLCEKPLTDPHGSKLQPNEMNNDDGDDDEEDDDASDPLVLITEWDFHFNSF